MRHAPLTVTLVSSLALGLLSCGAGARGALAPEWARTLPADLPLEGGLVVRPDATESPSIELRLPWRNDAAMLGWGAAHLWARPRTDHVSVTAIVDAPADRARWRGCEEVALATDGRVERIPARYLGRPLPGSDMVYEAMQVELDVQHLRAIAGARLAEGRVCGDVLTFSAAQRATILRFVQWFDHLAAPRFHGDAPFFRDVGPEPLLPIEQDGDVEPTPG